MTTARVRVVVMAALLCAAGAVALVLTSDREDADLAWAVCGPLVILSFVGTGLYAWRHRPESRIGELLVLLGFAWGVAALAFANSPFLFTIALVFGGLWGGLFLHLIMTFPTGRAATRTDSALSASSPFAPTASGAASPPKTAGRCSPTRTGSTPSRQPACSRRRRIRCCTG